MISSLNLSGWADYIIDDMSLSGKVVNSQVVSWLENNVSRLNLLIETNYYVSGDPSQILPEMDRVDMDVYQKMYECNYLTKSAKEAAMGAIYSFIEIKGDEQGSIKKASMVEVSKNLQALRDNCIKELNELISKREGGFLPSQIISSTSCC